MYLAGSILSPDGAPYRVGREPARGERPLLGWGRGRATGRAPRGFDNFLCTAETGGRRLGRLLVRLEREAAFVGVN